MPGESYDNATLNLLNIGYLGVVGITNKTLVIKYKTVLGYQGCLYLMRYRFFGFLR